MLDSLLSIQQTNTRNEIEKIDLLNEIAWEFNVVDIDSTKYYAGLALLHAKKEKYFIGQARALNLIAIYYSYSNKIDSSLQLNNEALQLSLKHDFIEHRSGIYNDLAIDYGSKGQYEKCLEFYYNALEVMKDDDVYRIYTLENIAGTHERLGNEEQADYYYSLCEQIVKQTTDKQLIHNYTKERGHYFSRKEQLDSALFYLKKAYKIASSENMQLSADKDLISIAKIYLDMEEYDSCIVTLQTFNSTDVKRENTFLEMPYFGILSNAYKAKGEYDKALTYRLKCKVKAEKVGRKDLMPHIHNELSEIYSAKKDFENAYHHHVIYDNLQDSIASVEKEKAFLELETQYQVQLKDERNRELKRANALLTVAAIFFVLFALVSTLLLISRSQIAKLLQAKN